MRHYPNDNSNLLASVLMVVLGLVLLIWPGHVMSTAMKVLGIALLAGGALYVFTWVRGRYRGIGLLRLIEGVVLLAAGLMVLCAPKFIISIIPVVVGVGVILNGALNLAQALELRRSGYANWGVSLALAIVTVLLGLVMVFNPFSTMEMLVAAIGGVILYNCLSNLWIESRYRHMFR